MRLRGNFEIQELGGMPYLMKRKDDGKLKPMGWVGESMAWLFVQLKGREFDVEDISQLLQKQFNMPSQQVDAEAINAYYQLAQNADAGGRFGLCREVGECHALPPERGALG